MFRSLWSLDKRSKFWVFFMVLVSGVLSFIFSPEPHRMNILKLDYNIINGVGVGVASFGVSFLVLRLIIPKIDMNIMVLAMVFMNLLSLAIMLLRSPKKQT